MLYFKTMFISVFIFLISFQLCSMELSSVPQKAMLPRQNSQQKINNIPKKDEETLRHVAACSVLLYEEKSFYDYPAWPGAAPLLKPLTFLPENQDFYP